MVRKKVRKTTDASKILRAMYVKNKKDAEAFLKERVKSTIAQKIYDLRTQAGLTQAQLARKIGSKASAISRMESADYNGQSLNTLIKVAAVMHCNIEIDVVPA